MSNFVFLRPTKIVFENNAEEQTGAQLESFGAKKVLIHYGSERVIKTGLMKKITDSLDACNIEYLFLGGVVPNPRLSKVHEGVDICKSEGIDFILAVGGGSVIDSSKAMSLGAKYDGDVWDIFERKAVPTSALPIGCVLTIPAAGSEMSTGAVITKDEGMLKRDFGSDLMPCKFSILNPLLTHTLPKSETVNGIVDILMHTLERYFHSCEDFDITDSIAEGLLKSVMRNGTILMTDPGNAAARESIMWSATLSHNNLTGCGSGGGDWSTHNIEHELSGLFDVAHGAGLSSVWGSWARYVLDSNPHRLAKFAVNVMGVAPLATENETGLAGIVAMEEYFAGLGAPISITQLLGEKEVTDEEIDFMARSATHFETRTFGAMKKLGKDDIAKIYTMAR
ncbi:MAG: iron-containing alcohol dehydrogenase [Bacillota bacterium]